MHTWMKNTNMEYYKWYGKVVSSRLGKADNLPFFSRKACRLNKQRLKTNIYIGVVIIFSEIQ